MKRVDCKSPSKLAYLYTSKDSTLNGFVGLLPKNVWQFLFKFKLSYLCKMRGYPQFSFWILIALAKICFFQILSRRGHTMQHCAQLLCHEVARNVADDGHTVKQLHAMLQK